MWWPWVARRDGVVPFRMKGVAFDVQSGHFSVAHLDALRVGFGVEFATDLESCLGGGCGNEFHHGGPARQRSPAPILCDVAKQAVLDLVPLRGAGRIVTHPER